MGQMPYCKETIIFIALIITITFCVLFDTNFSYKSIFVLNFTKDLFFLESLEWMDFFIIKEFDKCFFIIFEVATKHLKIF